MFSNTLHYEGLVELMMLLSGGMKQAQTERPYCAQNKGSCEGDVFMVIHPEIKGITTPKGNTLYKHT